MLVGLPPFTPERRSPGLNREHPNPVPGKRKELDMTAPYSKTTLLALSLTGLMATTALYLPWSGNPALAGEANEQVTIPGLPVVETVTVEETGLRSWATYSGRLQAINQSA